MKGDTAFFWATLLGIFVAVGSCGGIRPGVTTGPGSAAVTITPGVTVTARPGLAQRLTDAGFTVTDAGSTVGGNCTAQSYGQVHDYFATHACRNVSRASATVTDAAGNRAVLAFAEVEMPDAASAADLRRIVDVYGTGNVTELSTQSGPHQGVAYTGRYYSSSLTGTKFSDLQAEPLTPTAGSRALAQRASQALAS